MTVARKMRNTHVAAYAAVLRGVHQSQKRGVVVEGEKVMAMGDGLMWVGGLVVGGGGGMGVVKVVVMVGVVLVCSLVVVVVVVVVVRCEFVGLVGCWSGE